MAGSISCVCGETLVEEIDARGVRPVGAKDFVAFRRHTDYVMCASCLRTYNVRGLIAKAEERETIDELERLLERMNHEG